MKLSLLVRLVAVFVTALALTACEFTGINSVPLPLTKGGGSDAYQVTVYMENAVNLVPNSEVKVGEVTVGSVRRIEFEDWRAKLTIGLEGDVELPANAVARIGQKSLLGAEYLELGPPEESASTVLLADGDVIDTVRTGRYPETEEVLASLSLVLNGGGLAQVKTITTELNAALGGREDDVRALITELDTFVGTLEQQKTNIVAALEGLDRLAVVYAADIEQIDTALATIPLGVSTLAAERAQLTETLDALGDFGTAAGQILDQGQADLVANVANLTPIFASLADAGDRLTYSLGSISFPFPLDSVEAGFRGDYINFFATIDVSLGALERDFLKGTQLEGIYSGLLGLIPSGTASGNGDPLMDPLDGLLDPQVPPGEPAGPAAPTDLLGLLPGFTDVVPRGNQDPAVVKPDGTVGSGGGVLGDLLDALRGAQ